MESTDSQLLPYPEPEDFANGSQHLKLLAEAIDLKLTALSIGYDTALARPVIMRKPTPGAQFISANITSTIAIPNTVYEPTGYTAQGGTISIRFASYPAGIWMAGCYVATNPTGVVNQSTGRIVTIRVADQRIQPGIGLASYEELWDHSGSQVNVGRDATTFTQTFEIHNPDDASVSFRMTHGNTSSTLSVLDGFLWAAYVGELAN